MRNVFALLAVSGLVGIAFGVLGMVRHAAGPNGVPFRFENYGGPGTILAGLFLVAGGLYLWLTWPRLDRR